MKYSVDSNMKHRVKGDGTPHARVAQSQGSPRQPVLQLQQQVGNQAIQHLFRSGHIQAKLAISNPDDPKEREADYVASTIMHKVAGVPCSCSPGEEMCEECQQKQSPPAIQRRASSPSVPAHVPRIVSDVLRSPGHPLDATTRAFFEPRFGRDFSHVRVHADSHAADSARSIHAQAYTAGSNIVFAPGQYSPDTPSGRSLLAHELVHVAHQRSTIQQVQRQPADAGVPDAQPSPQPTLPSGNQSPTSPVGQQPSQPAATPKGPDENEADARAANPALPGFDRAAKTPQENEKITHDLVWAAFPDANALNAAFENLSPEVKIQVDRYAAIDVKKATKKGEHPDADQVKTDNRAQFLGRMRLYFNSWADVLSHFSQIEPVDKRFKSVEMFLHHDAKVRFERAATVLQSKGRELPRIGEGFSIRGFHTGAIQHPGFMIHAMGYAFDVAAKENPKIAFRLPGRPDEPADPALIATISKETNAAINMGLSPKDHEAFIESMGKRVAADDSLSAADDQDPDAIRYFHRFEQQFLQMRAGSLAFTQSISNSNRDKLLKLRQTYFDILKEMVAERKKGQLADQSKLFLMELNRRATLAAIPPLLTEWITAIDVEIDHVFAKHPEMRSLRAPEKISSELKQKDAETKQAQKDLGQQHMAEVKAMAEFEKVSKTALSSQARPLRLPRPHSGKFQAADAASQEAALKFATKLHALELAMRRESEAQHHLSQSTEERKKLADELKRSDTKRLHLIWNWIAMLRDLRAALSSPDLNSDAGVRAFERLTTGDRTELSHDARPENPPLLRLLDTGFFNPKGAFDLAFFEEMAHSGFMPGADWSFGGADPMHFELIEGRHSIQEPGKKP